jgi:hypothetical protein
VDGESDHFVAAIRCDGFEPGVMAGHRDNSPRHSWDQRYFGEHRASSAPLGLAAIKFWTRQKFKGTNALKKRFNPTRVLLWGQVTLGDFRQVLS